MAVRVPYGLGELARAKRVRVEWRALALSRYSGNQAWAWGCCRSLGECLRVVVAVASVAGTNACFILSLHLRGAM